MKFVSLWARLIIETPTTVFRFVTSEWRSLLRLSIVRASWGKRWFLGLSKTADTPVTKLSYDVGVFDTYFAELMLASECNLSEVTDAQPWCRCATVQHHERFLSLFQSDLELPPISVTLSKKGELLVVDGMRRLAVAVARGRVEIATTFVVPVKMLRSWRFQ